MEFRYETLGPCHRKVSVSFPAEQVDAAFAKQLGEINKSLTMPGFRKGRAPQQVLEKRFSKHLASEVRSELIEAMFKALVEDEKVEPLEPPTFDAEALVAERGKAMALEFELFTKPEFETPAWQGLAVDVDAVVVDESEIEAAIDGLRRRSARLKTVEGAPLELNDVAVIDWEALDGDHSLASDQGAYFAPARAVLGGFSVPDLGQKLVGSLPGAQIRVPVQVAPDDPREELRGRALELAVELKEVRRYTLPTLDAEFLAKHDFDDESELRLEMERGIRRNKLRARDGEIEKRLVERLVQAIPMTLPEKQVEHMVAGWTGDRRRELEAEGKDADEVERALAEDLKDVRGAIEHDLRARFLLDRLADATQVECTEADLKAAIEAISAAHGLPIDELLDQYRGRPEQLRDLAGQIRRRKARAKLREEAKLNERAAPASPSKEKA